MADDRLPCRRSESIAVIRSDKVMFRPLAISFPVPECIFETNARLVASDHDRALDDQRFHDDAPACCSKFVTSEQKICPALWLS